MQEHLADQQLKPRIYMSCGTDDQLFGFSQRFSRELQTRGFDLSYEEWPGGHDWTFFDQALQKALDFCFSG